MELPAQASPLGNLLQGARGIESCRTFEPLLSFVSGPAPALLPADDRGPSGRECWSRTLWTPLRDNFVPETPALMGLAGTLSEAHCSLRLLLPHPPPPLSFLRVRPAYGLKTLFAKFYFLFFYPAQMFPQGILPSLLPSSLP